LSFQSIVGTSVGDELSDSFACALGLALRREAVEVLGDVRDDRALVGTRDVDEILDIEQTRNAELLLGDRERLLEIAARVGRIERAVVEQIGSVLVDERTERETVLPVVREAANRRRIDVVDSPSSSSGTKAADPPWPTSPRR
jgi:hypothetical protein